jgi:PRD1 phage membrane DNA delivery
MSDHLINGVFSIGAAIVGLAVLAVLVSRNANTQGIIGTTGSAFSGALAAAEAPVTGTAPAAGGFGGYNMFSFGG